MRCAIRANPALFEKASGIGTARGTPEIFLNKPYNLSMGLCERQIKDNLKHVASAIHEQELAGLTVPAETVADLQRVARGEIDTDAVRRGIMRRILPS
jgi:Antitoxin VbhA